MSCWRIASLAAAAALTLAATPVRAQSTIAPEDAPIQLGPLALAPTIEITNAGRDSNVYNDASNPTSDLTATVGSALDAWLRMRHFRITGRSDVDAVYFKELTDLRAVDNEHTARVDLVLNRLIPYVTGTWGVARHRRNYEIDVPIKREDRGWGGGLDVRLTPKATIGIGASTSRVEYDAASFYLGTDLAEALNRRTSGERLSFRYEVTPLTTVGVEAARDRDRFALTPERDGNSFRVTPTVEFKPSALISGRAQIGFRRRTALNEDVPDFRGTFMLVDLGYTLMGHTRIGVTALRDLSHSYLVEVREYLLTGFNTSVTRRLGDAWDVGGNVGRYRLAYREGGVFDADSPAERILSYGIDGGYRIGHIRLGVQVSRQSRSSDRGATRGYERVRVTSSLTYGF